MVSLLVSISEPFLQGRHEDDGHIVVGGHDFPIVPFVQ
jgi:hypothetical protein